MFGDYPRLRFDPSMAPGVPHSSDDIAAKADGMMMVSQRTVQTYTPELYGGRDIATRKNSMELIGIVLTDERALAKNSLNKDAKSVILGSVCVESVTQCLDELRRLICTELPCLPASFNFLTKNGWPIHKIQEHRIKSSHVIRENNCICIKKEFEKPRIGVMTSTGDALGFVFTELNINIKQLRETIEQQLNVSQLLRSEYKFVERNGWPVMAQQEAMLSMLDIMLGQIVLIQNSEKYNYITPVRPTSLVYGGGSLAIESNLPSPQETAEHEPLKAKKSLKLKPEPQYSLKVRKESDKRPRIGKPSLVRPILISYVRAEAAQYALDLKQELVSLGFNVYLDVHEIKTGSDWQDALNHAVTHCFLFVPLITPMYGKTQWTNREVKLADVIGKKIIPVNFMDNWPPPCLAIQFASTQYIPWKPQDSDHVNGELEKSSCHRKWDPICIKRVSRQIAECYRDYYSKIKRTPSSKESVPLSSKPLLSPKEDYYSVPKEDLGDENKQSNALSQSIVISAHPRQRYIADDLKKLLEKNGHEVWCSVELIDQSKFGSEDITDPNSPHNLPTIKEGDVFFNQNDVELFNSGGEQKFSSKEPEVFGKRPLSRLMSQFSDISQPNTLSREKLDHLRTFQQKVDQAAVIIVLISESYTKSTFSHQQVFYCEHRKRVVLVRCDSAPIPKWFRLLMGNDIITKVNDPECKFDAILKARIDRALNPSSSETPKDATLEAKMNYLVGFLKKNLPFQDLCVYVAGSSKLVTPRAEEICKAIGTELAKVERVSLVTGGFFGAPDITAKTFFECRRKNAWKTRKDEIGRRDEDSVIHILPIKDSEDLTSKARQNLADGSFDAVPYGKTVYLGDSVKEREAAVARLLDTCLVIEGGPGVVHEVEEFIWNDHFVIPIISTGGAAGGHFGVPVKIFELPPGVDEADWSVLSELNATPEAVAKAVVNIMVSLKKSLSSPTNTLKKSAVIWKRKSNKNKYYKQKLQDDDMQVLNVLPSPPVQLTSMRSVFDVREPSHISLSSSEDQLSVIKKRSNWWRRFVNVLKRKD